MESIRKPAKGAKLTKARRDELNITLSKMRAASDCFYSLAVETRCHPFIELTGFMNEYIEICRCAFGQNIDFTQSNVHSGETKLPIKIHQAEYFGEKFGCIFAATFDGRPDLVEAFMRAAELVSYPRPVPGAPRLKPGEDL